MGAMPEEILALHAELNNPRETQLGDRCYAEHVAQHTQVLIFDNQGIIQIADDYAPLSIESMSQRTKGLVDALVEKKEFASGSYVVNGFAMGDVIAQHWAAHFPEYTY